MLLEDSREQNGKMLPNVSTNISNDNSATELIPINGSSNTSSNSSYYPVYGSNTTHLPVNNTTNSAAVGMSSCYSSYPSNYSSQQLYPSQVILNFYFYILNK